MYKDDQPTLVPFATGIVLKKEHSVAVLSKWDPERILDKSLRDVDVYVLLYYDPEMTQRSSTRSDSFNMSQLINLIAHRYDINCCGDKHDTALSLDERLKKFLNLDNVFVKDMDCGMPISDK